MFSLIITIIAIALVAALALATIYYASTTSETHMARAGALTINNQALQIANAIALYRVDKGEYPESVGQLVIDGYLSATPQPPSSTLAKADSRGFELISSAYAADAPLVWDILRDAANVPTYLVLGNSLNQLTCGATVQLANTASRSSLRDVVIPDSVNSALVYQCVDDGRVENATGNKAFTYFWHLSGTPGKTADAIDKFAVETPGVNLKYDDVKVGTPPEWSITVPSNKVGGVRITATGSIDFAPPLAPGAANLQWSPALSLIPGGSAMFIPESFIVAGYLPTPATWRAPTAPLAKPTPTASVAPLWPVNVPTTVQPGSGSMYCDQTVSGGVYDSGSRVIYRTNSAIHEGRSVPAGWSVLNYCPKSTVVNGTTTNSFDAIYSIPKTCPAGYLLSGSQCIVATPGPKYPSDGSCQWTANGSSGFGVDTNDPDCPAAQTATPAKMGGSCSTPGWSPGLVIRNPNGTTTVKAGNLNGCGTWTYKGDGTGHILPGMTCTGNGGAIYCE